MAAFVVLGASVGHGFVAVLALVLAAGPVAGGVAALAMAATVARWGTADLGAVAGDQAVLGAAVATGSVAAIASSALAALGLLLVARRRTVTGGVGGAGVAGWAPAVVLGAGAAVLAAGPSPSGAPELLLRAGATVVGVAAAVGVAVVVGQRPALDRPLTLAGAAAAAVGLTLAVLA